MLRGECLWLALLTGALGAWPLAGSATAATFLLNSTSDLSDVVPGDGSCSTGGTVDLGSGPIPACGLRAAIQEANALPGPDRIGVHSAIALDSLGQVQLAPIAAYPTITDTLTIDGTEVPGYDPGNPNQKPLIQIDGAQTQAGSDGLRLSGSGHTILALAIYRFPDDGILLAGADAVLIQGCHVGVRKGAAANGNGGDGIEISGGDFNTIGQTFDLIEGWTGRGNVVSANAAAGIRINGDANLVAGNRIGTDPTGAFINPPFNGFMGNGDVGVHVIAGFGNEVDGLAQLFDGTPLVSGNLISGNRAGVVADALSGLMFIRGNYIGTNAAGTSALGNTDHGILVDSSPLATIGGFDLGGNLVAGTTMGDGIEILDSSGSLIVGNTVGLSADQSTALLNDVRAIGIDGGSGHGVIDNVIVDDDVGIVVKNATDTSILANRVGNTQAGGVFGGLGGIEVRDSEDVEVGIPGNGNIVGPATFYGIALYTSSGISLEGNWVGVDPSGAPCTSAAGDSRSWPRTGTPSAAASPEPETSWATLFAGSASLRPPPSTSWATWWAPRARGRTSGTRSASTWTTRTPIGSAVTPRASRTRSRSRATGGSGSAVARTRSRGTSSEPTQWAE